MESIHTDKIYCDHSATTPVDPRVIREMNRIYENAWGNASSVHQYGRDAKVELEMTRETIAGTLQAARNEVLFTSGGTESDNLAIRGIAYAVRAGGNHIITTQVEHHAILHTCQALEKEGFQVTYLDVDNYGRVHPDSLEDAISEQTILVSIIHGNNEIGTLNPVKKLAAITKKHGIVFHTDAVQTYGKFDIRPHEIGIDVLSVSGHKLYGPKGIGFLYLNKQIDVHPQLTGGSQERNLRAGTENLPAIVGFATAAQISFKELQEKTARLTEMQQMLEESLLAKIQGIQIHGHPTERIPGLTHAGFDNVDGESLVMNLDMRGIAVSSGSACSSGSVNPSHVLTALGYNKERAKNAIRISLGRSNSPDQIPLIAEAISEEVKRIRRAKESKDKSPEVNALT